MLGLNQASAFDAVCAASYLEDYLDCLESLPDEIQRYISQLRQLDALYFDKMTKVQILRREFIEICQKQAASGPEPGPNEEILVDQKRNVLKNIKFLLAEGQILSDEKLKHLTSISEILEVKLRKLDQEALNLDAGISENLFRSHSTVNNGGSSGSRSSPSHSSSKLAENSGPTSSTVASSASGGGGNGGVSSSNIVLRSERRNACSEDTTDSGYRTSGGSNSAPNSNTSNSNSASKHSLSQKRPRRQKQYPDFVRDSDGGNDAPVSSSSHKETPTSGTGSHSSLSNSSHNNAKDSTSSGSTHKRRCKRNATHEHGSGSHASKPKFTLPVEPDEPTYCLCEQVSYGEMIGCDNNGCRIEWYHFNCVGLTSKPKGKWYCPYCRGDRPTVMKE